MAIAINIEERISLGGTDYLYLGTITPDNSWLAAGEAVDPTTATGVAGPGKFKRLIPSQVGGYVFTFNPVNQKLLAYRGKDTAAAGGADAALPAVADSVDLSALSIPFVAIGS